MRLTPAQIEAIKITAQEVLGVDAQVSLFGSRTDDSRRGGDIDLYIKAPELQAPFQMDAKIKLLIKLKQRIGEQRIDIVFAPAAGQEALAIHRSAEQTAVRL
jgi:hypothetical protein